MYKKRCAVLLVVVLGLLPGMGQSALPVAVNPVLQSHERPVFIVHQLAHRVETGQNSA